MIYFLRVAMSHQWANYLGSWTTFLIISARLRQRDKLSQHNTIADAIDLIQKSQRILILTGAGISAFNCSWSALFMF